MLSESIPRNESILKAQDNNTAGQAEKKAPEERVLSLMITGLDGFDFKEITADRTEIRIFLESNSTEAVCPRCGTKSIKIIKTYSRTVQHSPIEGKSVYLEMKVHHFECEHCKNTPGAKKSFTEPLEIAEKFQQRTRELMKIFWQPWQITGS